MIDELKAYLEQDDNIQAIGTGANGRTVMFVLDDAPELTAPYIQRDGELQVIRCSGFGIGPPYWPEDVKPSVYNDRMRPVPGGVSVGNWRITAGTTAGYVTDNGAGDLALLSNWHVLCGESGVIGDEIIQPGAADGGTRPADVVAKLRRRVDVHTDLTVTVDCAIAGMLDAGEIDENIIALGKPHGVLPPYVGQWLKKSGRSSETTAGAVAVIGATVKVSYGTFSKSIQDCVITGVPAAPGDSGSLMMDYASNAAVALLFAGGSTSDGYLITVGCRCDNVEAQLGVTFPTPEPRQRRGAIDVSKWQGLMDWQKAKAAGVSAAFIRAGSIDNVTGIPYEDSQFQRNAELAPQLMPVGYYWYFRPNWPTVVQSEYFCNLIRNANWKVPPVIDIEENGGLTNAQVAGAVWAFAAQIEAELGVRPIIYTSPGFWNSYAGPTTWAREYPLWVANWVNLGVLVPLIPNDWRGVQPVAWQFDVLKGGGSIYGAQSADIDLDTTYPGFELLLGEQEPPPPPEIVTLEIIINGHGYVSPGEGRYPIGSTITLTATPDNGWRFVSWGGDIDGVDPQISVLMDDDKLVSATFVEAQEDKPAEYIHNRATATVGLNYRTGPGTTYARLGTMPTGTVVDVLGVVQQGSNTWAQIGYQEFAAMVYNGQTYLDYVMEGEWLASLRGMTYGKPSGLWNRFINWLSGGAG